MRFHEHWQALLPIGLLTCLSFIEVVAGQCLPYPIAVPIQNITLSNGEITRGAELAIGHPFQSLAFFPQWPLNNTLVYGTDGYCTDTAVSTSACTTWRGGEYAILSSDTRRQPPNPNPIDGPPYPATTTYTDVFKVSENVTLENFAIGVPLSDWLQQGYHPMMAVGLGSNSTFLNTLAAGQHIAARVWSMFYGLVGGNANAQLDGTLVFGGYDKAKVSGKGYKYDLQSDPRCGSQMLVRVDDIVVHFPNGTDTSIVAGIKDNGFDACIVPDFPGLLTLANDPYFQQFQIVTEANIDARTFGQEFYTMLYNDGVTPYLGDMSIKIKNGPSIRIPNNQLVVPERYVDDSTGQIRANYSRSNLVMNSLNTINKNDLSQLGRIFLTAAYVMVNQDSEQFTLWAANPTTVEDLVAVDKQGKEGTTFCALPTNSTNSTNSTGTPDTSKNQPTAAQPILSTGAIAGIVVGVVVILAIAIGVVLWRRRRNQKFASGQSGLDDGRGIPENPSYYPLGGQEGFKWAGELHGDGRPVELTGVAGPAAPVELTGDGSSRKVPYMEHVPRYELGG